MGACSPILPTRNPMAAYICPDSGRLLRQSARCQHPRIKTGHALTALREWLRAPLEHAAADGNMDLFTRLMDAGADGSAGWWGCHRRTLLVAAATGKNENMVVALLRAGAQDDVDVRFGAQRESALHVGAEAASRALMFAGADPNVVDGAKRSPLHLAAQEGHDRVVSDLLLKGAIPNAQDLSQHTPLHFAAKVGRVLCVSKLLLGGADKNPRNSIGQTPLYMAARYDQLGVVEELLAAKADLNTRANGYRPLDIAAYWGHVGVLRALLRHGGDIKACDDHGYTVLHYVAFNGGPGHDNNDSVGVLLEAGADVEAKTTGDTGRTPLHVATTCRRLLSAGDTVRALLEGGANVNARDTAESNPLHYACARSNVGAVELLLRWGADETLVDEDGNTAADEVGTWEPHDGSDEDQRKADDQRIRHMLARAPADRSWRRRGWLVLARSRLARVQLVNDIRSSNGGRSAKVAKAGCDALGVGEGGNGDRAMIDLESWVRRVVGLDAEGVFRLVIGFL